jgi:CRISPR-associated protein Cmx8
LSERSIEKSGYLPCDCIIDIAIESALDIMMRLTERLTQSTGEQKTASTVLGIDVIHTEKQGNNIRILGASRLNPENLMINEYIRIRNQYWSPLFRKQRLLNLVNHSPWYSGFDSLLCTIPYKQITENEYFKHDVREALNNEESAMTEQTETKMEPNIEELVFELVKNYVKRKFYSKYELTWSNVKGNPKEEKEYNEKKEKIAKSAFLDVRSRTEKMDFINYFVSSLCSVPQHMKSEDYVSLTKALYEDTERIRTLTLLALSANS